MPYKNLTQDPTLPQGFSANFRERFWKKVNKTETCWLWTGTPDKNGYGLINRGNGKAEFAHRASWVILTGEVPILHVLHKCDTPLCVRHDHLFLGTQQDNMRDMMNKGRSGYGKARPRPRAPLPAKVVNHPEFANVGECHPRAKVNAAIVREMRAIYATGTITQRDAGARFGCGPSAAKSILSGRNWRHVIKL